MKGITFLKSYLKGPSNSLKTIWEQNAPNDEEVFGNLEFILHCVKTNQIKFTKKAHTNAKEQQPKESEDHDDVFVRPSVTLIKKRGRPKKSSNANQTRLSRSASPRIRRAAAQDADQKLAQVQSYNKEKKLRRPTDFDEKRRKPESVPKAKHRRTHLIQSAGSSSPKDDTDDEIEVTSEPSCQGACNDQGVDRACKVLVDRINTPEVKILLNKTGQSKSLDRVPIKRKSSGDLFNDSASSSEGTTSKNNKRVNLSKKNGKNKNMVGKIDAYSTTTDTKETVESSRKKLKVKKELDSEKCLLEELNLNDKENCIAGNKMGRSPLSEAGLSGGGEALSSEDEIHLLDQHSPDAHSSPIMKSQSPDFKGFNTHPVKIEEKQNNTNTVNNDDEVGDEVKICTELEDEHPNPRSRTKVIRKEAELKVSDKDSHEVNASNHLHTKTDVSKPIKSPEGNIRSRTKTIQKSTSSDTSEEVIARSRTKTIKKRAQSDDAPEEVDVATRSNLKNLASGLMSPVSKQNIRTDPNSPAPKGELVKKRVEDFEKLKKVKLEEENERSGRVTRNAVRNKMTSPTDLLSSKRQGNIPANKLLASVGKVLSVEKAHLTPLAVNYRMTPSTDSNSGCLIVNKFQHSVTRKAAVENNTALVQKNITEDLEKKRKEEERMKRQAKEEDAKLKKEKALKAASVEAKRKREEKLKKVAAAKDAAEKEKALQAAKAEKEKEEKMRLVAIEKEKLKEEQRKKKLLAQQKILEHEERRKQEKAARLAKLKEQEEEHKPILAMKEREQELIAKHQKAAQLRLAEAEKIKHQDGNLGKIAAVNNAKMQLQQGVTPSVKIDGAHGSTQSYDITPAREDRPILKSKTENDYGIDDANSEDSSDDESQPKKMIPEWAQAKKRDYMLRVHNHLPPAIWNLFMQCNNSPDVNKIFPDKTFKKRIRTSSAVWRTPPNFTP